MPLRSFHYVVSGVVQGVGFRQFLKRKAESYGTVGWTQNSHVGRIKFNTTGQVLRNFDSLLCRRVMSSVSLKAEQRQWKDCKYLYDDGTFEASSFKH